MIKLIHKTARAWLVIIAIFLFQSIFAGLAYGQENSKKQNHKPVLQKQYSLTNPDINTDLPEGLQTDLPQMKAKPIRERKNIKPLFDLSFLGPIFKILFYAIVALIIGYVLYLVFNSLKLARLSRTPKHEDEEMPVIPAYRPDKKTARILLEDADRLAKAGKYDEAVHLLLYRSIQDIEKQNPREIRRSLTAREISRLTILSDKAKSSFALIGNLVEGSFFGGSRLGAEDYQLSKQAYKEFAFEKAVS